MRIRSAPTHPLAPLPKILCANILYRGGALLDLQPLQAKEMASGGIWPEGSQYYLFHPAVPTGWQVVPALQFHGAAIQSGDASWSLDSHERARGQEWCPPEAAFNRKRGRLAGEEERFLAEPNTEVMRTGNFSCFGRSRYAAQPERSFAHFPREYFLVRRFSGWSAWPSRGDDTRSRARR